MSTTTTSSSFYNSNTTSNATAREFYLFRFSLYQADSPTSPWAHRSEPSLRVEFDAGFTVFQVLTGDGISMLTQSLVLVNLAKEKVKIMDCGGKVVNIRAKSHNSKKFQLRFQHEADRLRFLSTCGPRVELMNGPSNGSELLLQSPAISQLNFPTSQNITLGRQHSVMSEINLTPRKRPISEDSSGLERKGSLSRMTSIASTPSELGPSSMSSTSWSSATQLSFIREEESAKQVWQRLTMQNAQSTPTSSMGGVKDELLMEAAFLVFKDPTFWELFARFKVLLKDKLIKHVQNEQ